MRLALLLILGYLLYDRYRTMKEIERELDASIARLNAVRALVAASDAKKQEVQDGFHD